MKSKNSKKTKKTNFLASKAWQLLRQACLFRDNHTCFICGAKDGLVVHHLHYRRGHRELQDQILNCVTLCKHCHWGVHKSNLNILLGQKLLEKRPLQYQFVMSNFGQEKNTSD